LARNCSDWYPLLDICGLRCCLIADRDGVYVEIPTEAGRGFRFDVGHRSDLKPATIPI